MIEIAPAEYWIECTFPEIKMYLFCLNIDGKVGWRLPTNAEQAKWHPRVSPECWTAEDCWSSAFYTTLGQTFLLTPVRDLP